MIQRGARRHLVLPAVGALALLALVAPVSHAADQPISAGPAAGITVDGNAADWDLGASLLGPIHEDGDTAKATLAQGFARYDCDSKTLYLLVQTALAGS